MITVFDVKHVKDERLRIKIWDEEDGSVVLATEAGRRDADATATPISARNMHTKAPQSPPDALELAQGPRAGERKGVGSGWSGMPSERGGGLVGGGRRALCSSLPRAAAPRGATHPRPRTSRR
eukprot:391883-Rhodomonas_salina.1